MPYRVQVLLTEENKMSEERVAISVRVNVLFESKKDLVRFLGQSHEGWSLEKNHLPNWPLLTGTVLPENRDEIAAFAGVKTVEEDHEVSIPENEFEEEGQDPENTEGGSEGPSIQI